MQIQWQNAEQIKINNIDTSAIIEDADNVLNYFADKYIVTKYPIATGDLIEYAGIKYIITSQIDRNIENRNKKQYNYRARMRQMDYSIKIVLDGKVEEFDCVIEGQRFSIVEGQYLVSSADKIIVTLKDDIDIVKGMRFIKLNQAWKIAGIDKTKKGLIILYADVDLIDSNVDDLEEEIADYNLIEDIEDDPEEPEPDEPEFYIIITGADKMDMTKDETYIAKAYDENDEYIYKPVTFSVDDTSLANIKNQSNNQCELVANMNFNIGNVTLRATLVEDDTIYGEKVIGINQL